MVLRLPHFSLFKDIHLTSAFPARDIFFSPHGFES